MNYNNFDSTNVVSDMLNRRTFSDPSSLESYQAQCLANIQNNLKMFGFLEQYKLNLFQTFAQAETQSMNCAVANEPPVTKIGNIFAPKPMHVSSRIETTRIGRSHSMFVTNPGQESPVEEEKNSSENEKQSEDLSQSDDQKQSTENANLRKRMNVFRCPHTDRKHYAKNMCNNCYHKQGRNKKATKCPHRDRQNYAKGKCQNCYLNDYHKVKRRMKRESSKLTAKEDQDAERKISVETLSTEAAQETKAQDPIQADN